MRSTALVQVERHPVVGGPERREGERSEPERSGGAPTTGAAPPPAQPPALPGSEVVATPARRRFTAEFKRQLLAQVDAATEPGEVGAILRRHGLYSSHLTDWRRLRDQGALAGLAPRKRGRKPAPVNPLAAENARLERELARTTARAERAERLIDLQKKVAELLGAPLPTPPEMTPPLEVPRARTRRRR